MAQVEPAINFSEEDVVAAMKELPGYIDLTPNDFRQLYEQAYQIARRRIFQQIQAEEIMTRPAVTVNENQTLLTAIGILAEHHIAGAPVVDDQRRLTGVISEKDILRALGEKPTAGLMNIVDRCLRPAFAFSADPRTEKVREIMSRPPVSLELDSRLGDIVRIFAEKSINRLPVTGPDGRVAGIITRTDLISAVVKL